jgi:hypothetical protein
MQLSETRKKNLLVLAATVAGLGLVTVPLHWLVGGLVWTPVVWLCGLGQLAVVRDSYRAQGWLRAVRPAWLTGLVLAAVLSGVTVWLQPAFVWALPLLAGVYWIGWLFVLLVAQTLRHALPQVSVWLFDKTLELPSLAFRGLFRSSRWLFRRSQRAALISKQKLEKRRLERKRALSPEAQALLETKNRLERLAQRVRHDPKASEVINNKVTSVQTAILEALPKIAGASEQYDVHTLRQIANDYFPKTLEYFLETDTPAALFRSQVVSDGKSAEAVFLEQLDILENAIGDILVTVHNDSTQDLVANARFLRERFRKSDFESIGKN